MAELDPRPTIDLADVKRRVLEMDVTITDLIGAASALSMAAERFDGEVAEGLGWLSGHIKSLANDVSMQHSWLFNVTCGRAPDDGG